MVNAAVILKNVCYDNLCPFYAQVQEWNTNNIWNHTQAGVDANWFRFMNEFLTFNRTKTILTRLKVALDQPGYWSPIRSSAIGSWFLLSQYGL
uniref:Uncharacterized protein n=1 Tax=Acrobeloides nanus TaxID=290746 RepID=A0A914E6X2_9BILA